MATRRASLILKNSSIVARPLPSTLLQGEGIVNTADGIIYFSGVSQSTNNWVPAGTGTTANFFEAGSNLYNLKIRNQISTYSGLTDLSGQFLSGTTNGFVLAPISSIMGIDTYVTGFTYSNNIATISRNQSQPNLSILINTMTGLTVNGTLAATTGNIGSISATTYLNLPTDIRVTGGTANNSDKTYTFTNNTGGTFTVTALTDIYVTGGTYGAGTATFTNNTGGTFTVTGFTSNDTYVSGFTYNNNLFTIKQTQGQPDLSVLVNTMTGLTVNGTLTATTGNFNSVNSNSLSAVTVTGINTLSANSITATSLSLNNSILTYNGLSNLSGQFLSGTTNGFSLAAISAITGVDTYVTGFTYTPASNKLTISRNLGQPDLNVFITSVSGLTVSNLTANRLVYTSAGGALVTGTAIFDGTNMTLPSAGNLTVGTGGLIVGSGGAYGIPGTGDVVINGSLTVFGPSISAFTSQLYVEDNNVTINYNPSGSTTGTSIGAGLTIQDGNGTTGGNVDFDVHAMNGFTGLTAQNVPNVTEYTGTVGYANRAFVTQLNDIVIRSTNINTPNGVRLLAEFDVLDGGTY